MRMPRGAVGAEAFVRYLLGPRGAADLITNGVDFTTPPAVVGTPPPAPQAALSGP
jgi:hypothetical protein